MLKPCILDSSKFGVIFMMSAIEAKIVSYLYYPSNDTWINITSQNGDLKLVTNFILSCSMLHSNVVITSIVASNDFLFTAYFDLVTLLWFELNSDMINSAKFSNANLLRSKGNEFVTLLASSRQHENRTFIFQVSCCLSHFPRLLY